MNLERPRDHDAGSVYRAHLGSGWASLVSLAGAHVETAASGACLFDDRGQRFLDCGGYGVFFLGHRHPRVLEALAGQLERVPMTGRAFFNPALADAAVQLTRVAPPGLDQVYLTTSGSEAVELAIKLALVHGRDRFIAMQGGFHGKSLGALPFTSSTRYRQPRLVGRWRTEFVPFGDIDAAREALGRTADRGCVIVEPILGEGGVVLPPDSFLGELARECRRAGALLIVDEIQTGTGRTGEWWASAAAGAIPDVLLAGKALGGGVMPLGALLTTPALYEPFSRDPFLHTTTFGNAPLAAAVAAAVIELIEEHRLIDRARTLGEQLLALTDSTLRERCGEMVVDVRGRGLLIGIQLASPALAGELVFALMRHGVIASFTVETTDVVRLTPPVVMSDEDVESLRAALAAAGDELAEISG